jgi:hypothetical protein
MPDVNDIAATQAILFGYTCLPWSRLYGMLRHKMGNLENLGYEAIEDMMEVDYAARRIL